MYIDVAVGVCRRQVAVVDLVPVKLQRAITLSRLRRPRGWRQRCQATLKRHGRDGVAQVHFRFFVGEDDAAFAPHSLVGAGLLRMPVGVDECVDAGIPGSFLDGFEQRVRVRRQPAIDHERAVFAAHRNHIAARALKQGETAAQIRG